MKLKSLAVAAALALATSASFAESIETTITLSPSAGAFSSDFGAFKTQSGLFVDSFMFDLPRPTGNVSVTFGSITPNIDLVVATLSSPDGLSFAESPPEGIDPGTMLTIANAMGPLTLTILGSAGDAFALVPSALTGSYTGTVVFTAAAATAPVPVPATLALMVVGMGAVGVVARRRTAAS